MIVNDIYGTVFTQLLGKECLGIYTPGYRAKYFDLILKVDDIPKTIPGSKYILLLNSEYQIGQRFADYGRKYHAYFLSYNALYSILQNVFQPT